MSIPLLETKLYAPRTTGRLVPRPRLATRLQADAMPRLLLVSAPAGFGKSTMLAQLLDGRGTTAWLSLDQGDNEPVTFWSYVVAALRSAVPGVGETATALLDAPAPPMTTVLTSLVNELAAADPLVLVLDDYHLIETVEIHEAMGFLLDHLPAQVHLVIASRADPPLPLARLRARGELVEVRAADLRFTDGEAAAYFDGMGLHLDAGDVAALEGRTEGWIAALQLAALSLRGRDDVAAFIEGFAGDDRYVVDYLVEEVVQRQPEDVRRLPAARPRSWTGCPVRCATRSPASPAAAPGSRRSTGPTCSWSPSTTAASGTATTTCSPTCCAHGSSTSTPSRCPTCTAGPVPGTSRPATRRSRSSTRWRPATRTGPPASWRASSRR